MAGLPEKPGAGYLERLRAVHPEHDYDLDPKAAELLDKYDRLRSSVDTSSIMTCPGADDCPWARAGECPLVNAGANLPIGKVCPVETLEYADMFTQLTEGVKSSDKDGTCSGLEVHLCKELAAIHVQLRRVQKELSRNPQAVIRTVVGVNADRREITAEVANPAYDTQKKLDSQRQGLLRQLHKSVDSRQKVVSANQIESVLGTLQERMRRQLEKEERAELAGSPLRQLHQATTERANEIITENIKEAAKE